MTAEDALRGRELEYGVISMLLLYRISRYASCLHRLQLQFMNKAPRLLSETQTSHVKSERLDWNDRTYGDHTSHGLRVRVLYVSHDVSNPTTARLILYRAAAVDKNAPVCVEAK